MIEDTEMSKGQEKSSLHPFDIVATLDAIKEKCLRVEAQFRQARSKHEQQLKLFTAARSQSENQS
jgi:hypothetical protein